MTLEELITALEAADPDLVLPHGFTNPHSYRGDYYDLAFEPASDVTVRSMLTDARAALGTTYQGWKGGDFTMHGFTDCWLSMQGCASGDSISTLLLRLMLAAGIRDTARTATGQQSACGCGDPATPNVVHRPSAPCYVDEVTHIVADDSSDPVHVDDCPGCEAGIEHGEHCPTPETHNWGCGCASDQHPGARQHRANVLREAAEVAVRAARACGDSEAAQYAASVAAGIGKELRRMADEAAQ